MRLSDFSTLGIEILRDGEFNSLSKIKYLPSMGKFLVFLAEKSLLGYLRKSVSCIITTRSVADNIIDKYPSLGIAISSNPKEAFYKVHLEILKNGGYNSKKSSIISKNSIIQDSSEISDFNVFIGENTRIEEKVIIKPNVIIGNNCLIQAGSIIGNDCFETAVIDGTQRLIFHDGWVIIRDNVVIQSNTTISKGLFPSKNTIIGSETIIADKVHIAHGVQIGKKSRIAAGAIISGNVTIGENVWIGPGAIISNGLTIGDNCYVSIGSVVVNDIPDGKRVSGNFAIEHEIFKKFIVGLRMKE